MTDRSTADESIIAGPMLRQMAGKAKDLLTGDGRDTPDRRDAAAA